MVDMRLNALGLKVLETYAPSLLDYPGQKVDFDVEDLCALIYAL